MASGDRSSSNGFAPWSIEQAIHQTRCLATHTTRIMGRDNDNGLFAMPGDQLRTFFKR